MGVEKWIRSKNFAERNFFSMYLKSKLNSWLGSYEQNDVTVFIRIMQGPRTACRCNNLILRLISEQATSIN